VNTVLADAEELLRQATQATGEQAADLRRRAQSAISKAKVKLSDGTIETRSQVIRYIREMKLTYVTWATGVPEAKVIVASCPKCGSGDYITTEPDSTEKNNLLDLPRF